IRAKYQFGAAVESDWTAGSPYPLRHSAAGRAGVEGGRPGVGPCELRGGQPWVVERPTGRVQTMRGWWGPDAERAGTSRVTWEIEPVGDSCRLTVSHDQLPPDAPAELYGGRAEILSGLQA